ncbi:hypothetical protein RB653_003783 [Dictyostelium firmibasis]|uniref:IPT/TIG domain-containing protein n=1 Tax=Dictyostelium firmibasis TaxID=79012 RepID=A0AAN7Z2T3_9MYCE
MVKLFFSLLITLIFIDIIYSQYVSPIRINYYFNDNITIVTNSSRYYFTKWSLLRHVAKRDDVRLVLDWTCNLNVNNKEERICTTSMAGKMAQLYGEDWYCDAKSGTSNQTYSNHLPDSLYPFPIIYNYTKPSTRGSTITVSGEYLRFGTGNPFNIDHVTVVMTDRDKFYTDNFDCQNIRFDFPSGCGTVVFNLNEHVSTFNTNIQYMNPSINNSTITFNFDSNNVEQTSKIQLIGNNFCNNVSLVNVSIGNELINTYDMISVDHDEIQFNYNSSKQLYTEKVPIVISAGGTPTLGNFFISFGPIINSINSVPSSTGGIVTINGQRLKLPPQPSSFTNISNINEDNYNKNLYKILIGNKECNYIQSTINQLTCSLPSGTGNNLSISLIINDIGVNSNQSTIITFSYGIPIIESYKINGNIVTLYGSSFGETNKTLIILNDKIHSTTTPSLKDHDDLVQVFNNESMLTFKLPGNLVNANVSIKTPNSKTSNTIQLETQLFVQSISSPKTVGSINPLQLYFINSTNENSIPQIKIFNNNSIVITIESNTTSKPNSTSYDGSLPYQFLFPKGCGKKIIQVEIGNQIVNSSFSYSPPTTMYCNRSNSDSMLMNCFGENFGTTSHGNSDNDKDDDSTTVITFSNQTISTISLNDTMFSFKLKESFYKSGLHIRVCGIDSLIDYEIKLDSFLKSISMFDKFNTSGGYILINGDYLSLDNIKPSFKCSGDNLSYSSNYCKLINGTEIKCLVSSSGSGSSINKTCSLYLNDIEQIDKKVQIFYHSPFVLNFTTTTTTIKINTTPTTNTTNTASPLNGTKTTTTNKNNIMSSTTFKRIPIYKSKGGQVLIFGGNFYDPIESVTIGGIKCINPIFIDYERLSCNLLPSSLKSKDESSSDQLLYVNVTVGGQSGGEYIFKYDNDEMNVNENENNDDGDDNDHKRLRWLVPVIIIPIVFVIGGLSVLAFIFKKKLPCFSQNNDLKNK